MVPQEKPDMPLHIIADLCTNHDGDTVKAKELICRAHQSGADSAKLQIIYPEGLYIAKIPSESGLIDNPILEQRRKSMLPDTVYEQLADYSQTLPLPLSGSVFDTRGLDILDELDAPYIKLASCDLNNLPFVAEAAERGRPLILSTGMAELPEMEKTMETAQKAGARDIVLLHCVSIYPAPIEKTNLAMISILLREFGVPVGFSDHTLNSVAAVAAVALGATWFEKHFTLRTTDAGFDHAHSTPPEAFSAYVRDLRAAAKACTSQHPKVGEAEMALRTRARRGLYAARDMAAGEILRKEDVLIVRPESILRPDDLDRLLGKTLVEAIAAFMPIQKKLIK